MTLIVKNDAAVEVVKRRDRLYMVGLQTNTGNQDLTSQENWEDTLDLWHACLAHDTVVQYSWLEQVMLVED